MKRATDHLEPSAKRRQDSQGRKGDENDSDDGDADPGQFTRADDAVIKTRRIIRARRGGAGLSSSTATGGAAGGQDAGSAAHGAPGSESTPAAANPFAGITLVAPQSNQAASPQAAVPDTAQSAKGELGNKDAVATGEDCKDDAASRTPPRIDSPSEQPQKKAGQQQQQQPNVASQSPAEASKSYAAELDTDSVQTGKEDRPTVHEPSSTAAIKDNADTSTGDDKPRTESPLSPLHSGSDSTAPAIVAPSNGSAAKSSDNFTFGSALAAKTSASGFGALAGAGGNKPSFGFGLLQPPSQDAKADSDTSFKGFKAQADTADPDAPAQLFGAKPSAPADVRLSGLPAEKVGADEELVTGEEDEQTVWSADGTLFEFGSNGWKERGRGQARVKAATNGQGRIIMRQRGNLRLLLNANLWPDMAVNRMDGGIGVTFAVYNAASDVSTSEADGPAEDVDDKGKVKLKMTTYAFRTKGPQVLTDFAAAIESHKGS